MDTYWWNIVWCLLTVDRVYFVSAFLVVCKVCALILCLFRWCAEGGSLIGCDYCSNAFCKKCVLRNLGRKELSTILEEERKWYCYVCSPEPLVELVLACDSVLESLEQAQKRASRTEPNSVRGRANKGGRGSAYLMGPGGGPVPSAGLYQRMQRFVDVTTSLSHSFKAVVQSEREEEVNQEERIGQLRMFRTVLDDLQAANSALQVIPALNHAFTKNYGCFNLPLNFNYGCTNKLVIIVSLRLLTKKLKIKCKN